MSQIEDSNIAMMIMRNFLIENYRIELWGMSELVQSCVELVYPLYEPRLPKLSKR